jgi:hypothetical protein
LYETVSVDDDDDADSNAIRDRSDLDEWCMEDTDSDTDTDDDDDDDLQACTTTIDTYERFEYDIMDVSIMTLKKKKKSISGSNPTAIRTCRWNTDDDQHHPQPLLVLLLLVLRLPWRKRRPVEFVNDRNISHPM